MLLTVLTKSFICIDQTSIQRGLTKKSFINGNKSDKSGGYAIIPRPTPHVQQSWVVIVVHILKLLYTWRWLKNNCISKQSNTESNRYATCIYQSYAKLGTKASAEFGYHWLLIGLVPCLIGSWYYHLKGLYKPLEFPQYKKLLFWLIYSSSLCDQRWRIWVLLYKETLQTSGIPSV